MAKSIQSTRNYKEKLLHWLILSVSKLSGENSTQRLNDKVSGRVACSLIVFQGDESIFISNRQQELLVSVQ